MYKSSQLQIFKYSGDGRPNKCKFPFDGIGRSYGLKEEEKPLWERVQRYFFALSINVGIFHDERTQRYFCTVYVYRRAGCNKDCPAYQSVSGTSTTKTVIDKEGKDKKK